MTRKDYERAANIIRRLQLQDRHSKATLIAAFSLFFLESDNPRFDRERFEKACVAENKLREGVKARPKQGSEPG